MNYKKMRQILIVMLIFTNLIMLFNIVSIAQNDIKIQEKMIEDNIIYLQNKGVFVSEDMLRVEPTSNDALAYSSISCENIDYIIKDITSSENNLYIGENGTAKINDNGSFAISLTATHSYASIEELLTTAGFDLSNVHIEPTENGQKYTFKIEDFLVSNCFFEVILNNNTTNIAGTYVFSKPQATKGDDSFNAFLAIVEICNFYNYSGEIDKISFEYQLSSVNGLQILPIFKVEAGRYEFCYNIFDNSITKN